MSEFKKLADGSYVHNCYLEGRDSDPAEFMFKQNADDSISAFLNGYAIIPIETYEELSGKDFSGKDFSGIRQRINKADDDLHEL
jgi:hypothetical protein